MLVFSHYQTDPLLKLRSKTPQDVLVSADLNQTTIPAILDKDGLHIDQTLINWKMLKKISKAKNSCFEIDDGELFKIVAFSEQTNRAYSLYPTPSAPTMLIGGFPMHRIKNTNPWRDTQEKIKALMPVSGVTLDTCTGLGYTAIELAKSAEKTITIEFDPTAQAICRLNPWTQMLFDNPRIEQRMGDAFDVVPTFGAGQFSRILHDPPTLALAGHLYSAEFYTHLQRILAHNGILFHYIGDPESYSGRKTTRGVVARLKEVGFRRVEPYPQAYGVVALKG